VRLRGPSILKAGPHAWAFLQKMLAMRGKPQTEQFRMMLGMEWRQPKKQGKTQAQLEKQRRRRKRRSYTVDKAGVRHWGPR